MAKHGLLQCKSRPFIVLNKALSVAKKVAFYEFYDLELLHTLLYMAVKSLPCSLLHMHTFQPVFPAVLF